MADSGLSKFISYLLNLVLCGNDTASNAIYAQIFKTLAVSLGNDTTEITDDIFIYRKRDIRQDL